MKKFGAWLYHWMTVIAGVVVGGASVTLEAIDTLALTDIAAVLPPESALKIVTAVAIVKWACVLIKTVYDKLSVSA